MGGTGELGVQPQPSDNLISVSNKVSNSFKNMQMKMISDIGYQRELYVFNSEI